MYIDIEVYRVWVVHCEDCGILPEAPRSKAEADIIKRNHRKENHTEAGE